MKTTKSEFLGLSFKLRDGVERFWEPGYDYDDPEFWESYPDADGDFIEAVKLYDDLKQRGEI